MKRIICAIIAILLVVGTIMILATGFNLGYEFVDSKKVTIYIGKEFSFEDARQITDEVFENQEVTIEKLRPFEDVLSVRLIGDVSDEQITKLKEKVNEKYGVETVEDDIVVSNIPAMDLADIVKPYLPAIVIFVVGIIAYEMILYRKLGIAKVGLETLLGLILGVYFVFTGTEILGLTINSYIAAVIIGVEAIMVAGITLFFEQKKEQMEPKEEKKKSKINN